MIRVVKYFFQAIIIYLFFIFIKLIGLKISRIVFAFFFNKLGPLIKSNDIINENLDRFIGSYNEEKKTAIKFEMCLYFVRICFYCCFLCFCTNGLGSVCVRCVLEFYGELG